MFQPEIKFITDFTLNNIKKLGSFFTFEKLLETNIHPAIKQYVNAEFEFLIYEDRQKLIQGSLFDYSGPRIHHHFSMIADEIKKTKKVSYEDMKILVSRSVSFNVSYVLKPNWSLQKLIFGEKKNISIGELEMVLNYLYYYDYLKNVFKAYLSKRNIVNLSSTEFELILNKIDRELFSTHFEKLVDNSLVSIADFFSIGGLNKRDITVETVEILLKEKNLIDHLLKLKRAIPNPAKRKYNIDDIRKIIYSSSPVEPESILPTTSESDSEVEGDFEKVKTVEEAEIKSLTQDEEPVNEEFKSDDNIIQELIQDEIVKQDIEELIEEDNTPGPEIEEDEQLLDGTPDEEIMKEKPSQSLDDDPIDESVSEGSVKTEPEIESDTELDPQSSLEQEQELQKSNLSNLISEEDNFIIEETELLDEKDEEELFSFYDEELKDIDELKEPEEEILNVEDVETTSNINDDDSLEEGESVQSLIEDYELPEDKVEIEEEGLEEDEIQEEKIEIETSSEDDLPEVKLKKKRDVFSFLTSREIDKITDTIFNSDSEDFANTIERISECQNFNEATEILKSLFTSSKISPQSKQAVILTNAIANYFDQV
ncbi:MAG TPA: hypothetical protein VK870_03525 [Ignavibacteriaceae bacterium]|nr:hypothetical protein [Ignavibacteriaceae bacterium]